MANMSYCRFRNTSGDLEDCWDNWDDIDEQEELGEWRARQRIIRIARLIVEKEGTED